MPRRQARAPDDRPENDLPIEIRCVPEADTVPERLIRLAQELQRLFDERAEHKAWRNKGPGRFRH